MFNLLAIDIDTFVNQMTAMETQPWFIITEFFTSLAIDITFYLLMAIGIFTLAKRYNLKNRWLSFIPFFNLTLLGALLGKTNIWGIKVKNIGFWAGLLGFLSFLVNELLYVYRYINLIELLFNVKVVISNPFLYGWVTGTSITWQVVDVSSFVIDIASLFFEVGLIFIFFKVFAPQRAFLYSILSVFIDPLFGILVFVCRKNSKYVFVRADFFNQQNPTNTQNNNKENPFSEFDTPSGKTDREDDYFN